MARKRLAAIKEFSDLGSGFRVAALDLEIRGAGNLLGGEQSGHIDAVGFEMYMKLLEETVRELKGEDLEDDVRATVNLRIDFRIDDSYVPDMNQRLMIYRRIAAARSEDELTRIMEEMRDRYGPPPVPVLNLADYGRIRVMADELGIETLERDGRVIVIRFGREGQSRARRCHHHGPGTRRSAADPAVDPQTRPPHPPGSQPAACRRQARSECTAASAPNHTAAEVRASGVNRPGGPPGRRPARSRPGSRRPRFCARRRKILGRQAASCERVEELLEDLRD